MNELELKEKLSNIKSDIRSTIEGYINEHAKYKIGDVVESYITRGSLFVITQIGYSSSMKIVYYGKKIRKSDGEITYFDMDSSIGTNENALEKTTLKLKNGEEISHYDNSCYFNNKIFINITI